RRRERGDGPESEGARRPPGGGPRGDRAAVEWRARHLPRHALPPAGGADLDAPAAAAAPTRLARGERRRGRPARGAPRGCLADEPPRHAPDARAPAGALPE